MKFYKKEHAYSLAEIMVVMLVLTIIFAATAPFFTKRRIENKKSQFIVWNLSDIANYDAYTTGNKVSDSAQLFFGITPKSGAEISSLYSPLSKLVIRSGPVTDDDKVQRQIQFRYGYNGLGQYAGSWLMDRRNVLMGGEYSSIEHEDDPAYQNTAIGFLALNNISKGKGNTAIGYNALADIYDSKNSTAIGANTGGSSGNRNTFIGANAGKGNTGDNNTFIGYNSAGGNRASGSNNTFIGTNTGYQLENGSNNLAVGLNALQNITSGSDNVAIGANALKNLTTGSNNVAIGYNACSNVTTGSNKTCIGADSGPSGDSTASFLNAIQDDEERTYIGSSPKNYGGDAVLEIHNVNKPLKHVNTTTTASSATTVINGNLIVTGKVFFSDKGQLYEMKEVPIGTNGTTVLGGDKLGPSSTDRIYNIANYSDRRLKNIGTKFSAGLDELSKIKIYNYTFKNDEKKSPRVGVIAQQLEQIFPNAVSTGADGYLRIRWDEMFYAAINAVKELDNKITAITLKLLNIETQITQLEEENLVLQTQVDQLSKRVNKLKTK